MKRILVVGAGGQIGSELVAHLQKVYGHDNVIAADVKDENVTVCKVHKARCLGCPGFS